MRLPQIICSCSEVILKSVDENKSKIRSKILIIKDGDVYAVCKGCGVEIGIPLEVNEERANPPLFIKNYSK